MTRYRTFAQFTGTRTAEGALGWLDPRALRDKFEEEGIRCWIDVERVGQVRHKVPQLNQAKTCSCNCVLFEDIAISE